MEPRIQYAKTSDGVNIAFYTLGQGKPFIEIAPLPFTHLQLEWDIPEIRRWYERLAKSRTLVRYDGRGFGMSDRDTLDFSLEALAADLEAVVERVGGDEFALMGSVNSGPIAISYAVAHPERVSHLILWCSYARGETFFGSPVIAALRSLAERDWLTFSETAAHSREGWPEGGAARKFARLIREAVTPGSQAAFMDARRGVDVTDDLCRVQAPTLVLHRKDLSQIDVATARDLAARIPNARLVLLEGAGAGPYLGNTDDVVAEIYDFLGEAPPESDTPPGWPSGTAIILFADIVDSTALTERMGDTAFREKARGLDGAMRTVIRDCEGTPVEGKLLGDGVLAVFTSARQAIEAALACGKAGDEGGLPLHLGIHAGDVIREGDNVYGGAVNIASRISGLSAPGEVLVSETVRSLARTSAGVGFEERGERALKGVGEPVRVWAVVAEPGTENPEPAGNGA
jgi:class 3 adenylate cyclase/pimeloyl-ACP methyl ester carboxylesterase